MAHKTLISGTAYEITSGKARISGTGYSIKSGKTLIGGTGYTIPIDEGILASDIAVGTSVYLKENGNLVEYIVVHQGNPSTTKYDASCNGTWLMRKDLHGLSPFYSDGDAQYIYGELCNYCENTIYASFDSSTKSVINQVKIPYQHSKTKYYDLANGYSCHAFALGAFEVGFTRSDDTIGYDGAILQYFSGAKNAKRIAYLNGTATAWWLRTRDTSSSVAFYVTKSGSLYNDNAAATLGVRCGLVLSSSAVFNEKTMCLV